MLEVSECLGSEKEISVGEIGKMYIFDQVYKVNEKKYVWDMSTKRVREY